jgi:hypothetical protein
MASYAGMIPAYWVWAYWANPLSYAFRSLAILEFTAPRWQTPHYDANRPDVHTLGDAVLDSVGLNISRNWMWIGFPALFGFIVAYNIALILAMAYLSCTPGHPPFSRSPSLSLSPPPLRVCVCGGGVRDECPPLELHFRSLLILDHFHTHFLYLKAEVHTLAMHSPCVCLVTLCVGVRGEP